MVVYIESPLERIVDVHFGGEGEPGPDVPQHYGESFGEGHFTEDFTSRLTSPLVIPTRGTTWQITGNDGCIVAFNTLGPGNPGGTVTIETRFEAGGVALFTSGEQVFEVHNISDRFTFSVNGSSGTIPMGTPSVDVKSMIKFDPPFFAFGRIAQITFWSGAVGVRVDPPFL